MFNENLPHPLPYLEDMQTVKVLTTTYLTSTSNHCPSTLSTALKGIDGFKAKDWNVYWAQRTPFSGPNIDQEAVIKTIPKKKKRKKAKWLSEEVLKIAVKEEKQKVKEKRKDISIWMQSSKE